MKNWNGWLFNRERVFLAAMQEVTYLEMAYETSVEGLVPAEAARRLTEFGANEIRLSKWQCRDRWDAVKFRLVESNLHGMYGHRIAVLRKGVSPFFEIPATSLVPGDVVFLISGDVVPADIRIIDAEQLVVDQHFLDGCRNPVPKSQDRGEVDFSVSSVLYLPNMVFAGTQVLQGKAKGIVISTGSATYLGKYLLEY